MEVLFLRLGIKKLFLEGVDKPWWEETNSGNFSTKAMYKVLEADHSFVFPSANFWGVHAQPKIAFFAWEANWGNFFTLDQLHKRGFSLANRCCFCQKDEETANYILLHCEAT